MMVAATDTTKVAESFDGGVTWTKVNIPIVMPTRQITGDGTNFCISTGTGQVIHREETGSWRVAALPSTGPGWIAIAGRYKQNEATGGEFIIGAANSTSLASTECIMKSNDGGQIFTIANNVDNNIYYSVASARQRNAAGSGLNFVTIGSTDLVGNSRWRTRDGGQTWIPLPDRNITGGEYFNTIPYGLVGDGEHYVFFTGQYLSLSSDYGETWSPKTNPINAEPTGGVSAVLCYDDTGPFILAYFEQQFTVQPPQQVIYISRDWGETWFISNPTPIAGQFVTNLYQQLAYAQGNIIFLGYGRGNNAAPVAYVSKDMGTTWLSSPIPRNPSTAGAVFALASDGNTSIIINSSDEITYVWRSIDGGLTWVETSLPYRSGNNYMVNMAAKNGTFIAIRQGPQAWCVASYDSGLTWRAVSLPAGYNGYSEIA